MFSACIVRCGAVCALGKCECIVMKICVCVHPVAVLNAAFSMSCSLLMQVEDERGDHMEEAYSRAGITPFR